MMSICLQSMVDELMVKKSGGSIKKVSFSVCLLLCNCSSVCQTSRGILLVCSSACGVCA